MKTFQVMVVLVAQVAVAQNKSLKDFLDSADVHNVDRRLAFEQREKAAADYNAAWSSLLPALTTTGGWTNNQFEAVANFPNPATGQVTKLVIIPKNQLDAVIRVDLPLFDTTRWLRAGAAGASESSAAEKERLMRDVVKRQVVGSYYGYAAALAVRKSAMKSVAVAQAQAKLIDVRFQAGAATELEQMRARAELARTQQVVADVESLVAVSRRTLQTVSFLEPPEEMALPLESLNPEKPVEEFEKQLEGLPAVKSALYDAQAADRLSLASKLTLLPSISAQFTQRFTNATGFQNRSAIYAGGVNFLWRLDAPTFAGMSSASAAAAMARLGAERARLTARDQIFQDWNRFEAARQKAQLVQAQVTAAQRASQVAKDRYAVGAATQVDVIQAERDLFGAEVAQIQAQTELSTAKASLRISSGLPVVDAQ